MAKAKSVKKKVVREIALERMQRLFEEAEKSKSKEKSGRFVELALKIGSKCNVSPGIEMKKKYCKKCRAFLDAKNSKIRISNGMIKIKCGECGHIRKIKAGQAAKSNEKKSGNTAATIIPNKRKGAKGGKSR